MKLTPERQKQRTLEILVEQAAGLASKQPVLVICEDAHWIDPTTLEMFGLLIERVQKLALLFDDPSAGVQPGLEELYARNAPVSDARTGRGRHLLLGVGRCGSRRFSAGRITAKTNRPVIAPMLGDVDTAGAERPYLVRPLLTVHEFTGLTH